jgi:hypothetical protein
MNVDRQSALWAALIVAASTSIVVTIDVARQSLVIGSHEGRWVYGYLQPLRATSLVVAALATGIAWLTLVAGGRRMDGRVWRLLLLWSLVGIVIQALLRSLTPFSLEQMFVSEGANSFYSVTRRYYASSVLRDFDALRESWPLHAQSNMPGKLMLIYGLKNLSRAPWLLAWMVIVVSNLGVIPMYWFARDLFDDARVGLWSAALYLLVPGKLFFFPLMNAVTPVVVLTCACLLLRWLTTGHIIYAAAFGVALYGLTFFEPLPLVIGILFVALIARAWGRGTISTRQCLIQGLVGMAAFAVTYSVVRRQTGFDLLVAFRAIAADAAAFNQTAGRPYGLWAWQNLWDFAFGMGIGQAIIALTVLGDGLIEWRHTRLVSAATWLSASLLAVVLATDLIGVNRGEVVRLWIFLACFLQIPTAYLCARLDSLDAFALMLAVTIFQGALGTAMIGFVLPG